MKIKPFHFYALFVVLIVGVLTVIILNDQKKSDEAVTNDTTSTQNQSQDPHQKFLEGDGAEPGKANVSQDFMDEFNKVKTDYENNPEDTAKALKYGELLFMSHKESQAIPIFNKILEKDPKRTDVYIRLTVIYYKLRDFDKAEEVTNKILSYDKNNLQAKYNLGAIAAEKGDKARAKELWNKLINENPDSEVAKVAKEQLEKM